MPDTPQRDAATPAWEDRLKQEPAIDIDYWALLAEARILQADPPAPNRELEPTFP